LDALDGLEHLNVAAAFVFAKMVVGLAYLRPYGIGIGRLGIGCHHFAPLTCETVEVLQV
jgi:hypothetical protein